MHVQEDETLVRGYPEGYPTPDPVHLVNGGGTETLVWGYPEGVSRSYVLVVYIASFSKTLTNFFSLSLGANP